MIHDGLEFHNVGELEALPGGGLKLQRLPAAVRDGLGIPGHRRGRFYAHRLSGVELRFVVESPFVAVSLMALEADTHVVVYRGDFAHGRYELRAGVATTLFLEDPPAFAAVDPAMLRHGRFEAGVWRILFHQDARAAYLGHDAYGAVIRPPRQEEVPSLRWLAYGSSITYGANTQHPATSYVQQAARRLGVDVLNLGLPGSCMAEPAMAEYLASRTDVDLMTCELGVNMTGWIEPPEFERRVRHLLMTIADRRPERPVVALNIYPNRADYLRNRGDQDAVRTEVFNRIVPAVVRDLGRSNLHVIDGRQVLQDLDGLTTDLLHPSDEGHMAMGSHLATALRSYLPG
jgi:lysophospholipase L1-like esterase